LSQKQHPDMKARHEHDIHEEGKDQYWLDIDRMINEGLGGGVVSEQNGRVDAFLPLTKEERPAGDLPYNKATDPSLPAEQVRHGHGVREEDALLEDGFEATVDEP